MKLFRNSSGATVPNQNAQPLRLTRRSNGLGEVAKVLAQQESLCILDLGSTSANNIRYFTERGTQDLQRRPSRSLHRPRAFHNGRAG